MYPSTYPEEGAFAMSSPDASVIQQISAAMSVCNLQHQVNVANIANRDSQGYQRMRLQFDAAMDRAGSARIVADHGTTAPSLEQDLVTLSTNLMHYQVRARSVSRYFSIIAAITNPNRG
jgi:flagellar basal body rod protein FlgG